MPKTFYQRVQHFHIFQKNGITEFFYILLIVSFARKKIGGHHASFPTIRGDGPFFSEFRTRMSSLQQTICY
jgi:hypothetical protein